MRDAAIKALESRFRSYQDIIESISENDVGRKLDIPKNKSLAEHLWCVIGARESYAKALAKGSWGGFSCSLASFGKGDFSEKLETSAAEVLTSIRNVADWTLERDELLVALSEHEVMHEDQLIRHLYGLEIPIPDSVKWA